MKQQREHKPHWADSASLGSAIFLKAPLVYFVVMVVINLLYVFGRDVLAVEQSALEVLRYGGWNSAIALAAWVIWRNADRTTIAWMSLVARGLAIAQVAVGLGVTTYLLLER